MTACDCYAPPFGLFRRFFVLSLNSKILDETTVCCFRNALKGQTDKLFSLVMNALASQGIRLKSAAIVDATVIQSAVKDSCGGKVNEQDPDAV